MEEHRFVTPLDRNIGLRATRKAHPVVRRYIIWRAQKKCGPAISNPTVKLCLKSAAKRKDAKGRAGACCLAQQRFWQEPPMVMLAKAIRMENIRIGSFMSRSHRSDDQIFEGPSKRLPESKAGARASTAFPDREQNARHSRTVIHKFKSRMNKAAGVPTTRPNNLSWVDESHRKPIRQLGALHARYALRCLTQAASLLSPYAD